MVIGYVKYHVMGREFFSPEKLRQPVVSPAKTRAAVEIGFHSQDLLPKGAYVVAVEAEPEFGVDHIHHCVEGVRDIQHGECHEETEPGRVDDRCGHLEVAGELGLTFGSQRMYVSPPTFMMLVATAYPAVWSPPMGEVA